MTSFLSAPLIGFGQVRHARLRPASNRFSYGAYFLRLPLRSLAARPWPSRMLGFNRAAPMSVLDRDHGDGRPLLAWIDGLLAGHGISDAAGEMWLHTSPRVFGYVFNPVSFWFCEDRDGRLQAVLAEVNNTFGERHAYLLRTGEPLEARKVFHVSPFFPVVGRYRFRFEERAGLRLARIDYFDDDGPLLYTSISGRSQPLTRARLVAAFLAHPFMTFAIIGRIHWQALRLWLKRVPFVRKPAPPVEEV